MQYWLMKTEPETFSWDDLENDGRATWDGVRNFAARLNLRAMKKGDKAFIYHSVTGKAIVGIAEITREAYPDPTAIEGDWTAVDIKPVKKLKHAVSLEQIKKEPKLSEMKLLKIGRLSVSPVTKAEYDWIIKLSEKDW